MSSITVDLASPTSQIHSIENLRTIITYASKEFKFLHWFNIHVDMAKQSLRAPLRVLVEDGSFAKLKHLDRVVVKDAALRHRFYSYDKETRNLVRTKVGRWISVRKIDRSVGPEYVSTAVCMARLHLLNWELKLLIAQSRRDSAVEVDAMERTVAPVKEDKGT